jgi:hypothetical protein
MIVRDDRCRLRRTDNKRLSELRLTVLLQAAVLHPPRFTKRRDQGRTFGRAGVLDGLCFGEESRNMEHDELLSINELASKAE